jgi:hypothetical protein
LTPSGALLLGSRSETKVKFRVFIPPSTALIGESFVPAVKGRDMEERAP